MPGDFDQNVPLAIFLARLIRTIFGRIFRKLLSMFPTLSSSNKSERSKDSGGDQFRCVTHFTKPLTALFSEKDNDEQFNDFSWAIIIMRFSTHFALGFCWFDQSFANYLNLREVGFSLKMHYDEQKKKVFSFFQLNAITFTLRYLNWLMHPHLCTLCQLNTISF